MRKVFFWILGILVAMGIAAAALFFLILDEEEEGDYRLYYLDQEADRLVPVWTDVEESDPYALVAELYLLQQKLPEGRKGEDLVLLLPSGLELLSYELESELLTLNFSEAYSRMHSDREILVRAGLVRLFTQIPEIRKVQFRIEGQPLLNRDGVEVGALSASRFVENSGKEINSYLKTTMTLYYADSTGEKLVPEERSVYYNSNVPLEKVVVEQLIKGPKDLEYKATLPSELNILSVTIQDEICYVNLDDSFTAQLGMATSNLSPELAVYSIVNSLADVCGVNKIQFSINGRTNVKIGTIDLNHLFDRNKSLVVNGDAE